MRTREDSCDTPRMAVATLPDLNLLPAEALKALVLAQHEQLLSRESEIEHLKLLIAKLQRMQFGRKSEKLAQQIEQLELRLEELRSESQRPENDAAGTGSASPPLLAPAAAKPARRALPDHLPRQTQTARTERNGCVRIAAASCASWAKMSRRCWSTCRPVSW